MASTELVMVNPLVQALTGGKLTRSEALGYIRPGWALDDYMRYTIDNMGWDFIVIWGEMGGGKSNLLLQLGYMVYKDWDIVLDQIIFTPEEFRLKVKDAVQSGERIPWLGWDDIGAWASSDLYHIDRRSYSLLKRGWQLIRPRVSVVACTIPCKADLVAFMLDDMTFEIHVGKRYETWYGIYICNRWLKSYDLKNPKKIMWDPIIIEAGHFPLVPEVKADLVENLPHEYGYIDKDGRFIPRKMKMDFPGVPRDVFKQYFEKRLQLADTGAMMMDLGWRRIEGKEEQEEKEVKPIVPPTIPKSLEDLEKLTVEELQELISLSGRLRHYLPAIKLIIKRKLQENKEKHQIHNKKQK